MSAAPACRSARKRLQSRMPSRPSIPTLLLLCLFCWQALASASVPPCRHAPAPSAPAADAGLHAHHAMAHGSALHADHGTAASVQAAHAAVNQAVNQAALPDCHGNCGDRHCAGALPGLSATRLCSTIDAAGDAVLSMPFATSRVRDAHDRDLIRPPSLS